MMTVTAPLIFGWLIIVSVTLTQAVFQCHHKIDMVILLDRSASITREQFADAKKFASDLVKHFDISRSKTNVVVLAFSQTIQIGRKFSDDTTTATVLKAIDGLNYEGSSTKLHTALTLVNEQILYRFQGARFYDKDVRKAVIVLTDGFSSRGFELTRDLTEILKNHGVEFFSVGISGRVNKDELSELTSQPIETHQLLMNSKKSPFRKDQIEKFATDICK